MHPRCDSISIQNQIIRMQAITTRTWCGMDELPPSKTGFITINFGFWGTNKLCKINGALKIMLYANRIQKQYSTCIKKNFKWDKIRE